MASLCPSICCTSLTPAPAPMARIAATWRRSCTEYLAAFGTALLVGSQTRLYQLRSLMASPCFDWNKNTSSARSSARPAISLAKNVGRWTHLFSQPLGSPRIRRPSLSTVQVSVTRIRLFGASKFPTRSAVASPMRVPPYMRYGGGKDLIAPATPRMPVSKQIGNPTNHRKEVTPEMTEAGRKVPRAKNPNVHAGR